jgi:hypothetical protein
MPNVDRPSGLSPVQYLNGTPWTGGGRVYCIPSTDSTNAYAIGDPVASAGSADTAGIPTVTLATAGTANAIRGVIVSAGGRKFGSGFFDFANLDTIVIPQTKTRDYYVLVVDDPNVIFEVQEVSGGTALTATEVGLNANLKAGTNNGFLSGWEVDNSGETGTATLQVRLLQLAPRIDNAFGEHAKWWVKINNHELAAGTAGV